MDIHEQTSEVQKEWQFTYLEGSDRLVTTKLAAQILGLDEGTLCNWRSKRLTDLTYVKIGGTIRYRVSDLNKFIERNLHINESFDECHSTELKHPRKKKNSST
jgi:hypothetical protein